MSPDSRIGARVAPAGSVGVEVNLNPRQVGVQVGRGGGGVGPAGPTGPTGPPGVDGRGLEAIQGTLNDTNELPTSGMQIGDAWIIDGDLWIYK
jgi:hypothetical protein